jgi:hypothetical protein
MRILSSTKALRMSTAAVCSIADLLSAGAPASHAPSSRYLVASCSFCPCFSMMSPIAFIISPRI